MKNLIRTYFGPQNPLYGTVWRKNCINTKILMPLRWYGNGDQSDPLYLHFSRIVNLTIHFMLFAAVNSCLWFFQNLGEIWSSLKVFTGIWLLLLMVHLIYVIIRKPASEVDKLLEKE